MKNKNKPKDASAKIEMDGELDKISFGTVQDYYNDVVAVIASYNVKKTDTELIKLMAKKVLDTMFAKLIIEYLNQSSGIDFKTICEKINEIQRLTKATGANKQAPRHNTHGKEVQLANTDRKFLGVCGNCQKRCGDYLHPKSNGGGGTITASGGGIGKPCNNCGMKWHNEDKCWKKHPGNAPQWYKDMQKKKEASGVSVEMMLASLELNEVIATSSIEAEEQVKAEVQQDLHGIKAVLAKIEKMQDFAYARL